MLEFGILSFISFVDESRRWKWGGFHSYFIISITLVVPLFQRLPEKSTSSRPILLRSQEKSTESSTLRFWWTWAEPSTAKPGRSGLRSKESTSSSSPLRPPALRPSCGWWSTVTGWASPSPESAAPPLWAACPPTWPSCAKAPWCTSLRTVVGPGPTPLPWPSRLGARCLYKWNKMCW